MSAIISASVFIVVIVCIIFEKIHLTIAALLGTLILIFTHTVSLNEAVEFIARGHQTLLLFFGVMVLIRAFEPTKIFDYLATKMVIIAKGRGNVLLLGIIGITTPICAVLPNATTVMLLAPLIPPLAQEIGVNFIPLLILMVFVANSAGLITLVGDPATFIVGDAINMTFVEYLQKLTLGGLIAVVSIAIITPILFKNVWKTNFTHLEDLPHPQVNHPRMVIIGGLIMLIMLLFFIFGESLPMPISPAAVALLGATLALLLAHHGKIDTINNILRDVDWSTLIFFMSIFVLIGSLEKTGVVKSLSGLLAIVLGQNIFFGSLVLIFIVGILSSVVPNIPLVVAMVPLLKEYLVSVGLMGTEVLDPNFTGQLPPEVLPLFYAMMFGATLGGNGTLVGASSNIVAAGIAEQHGEQISFQTFLKYGLPVMIIQLIVSAIYISLFFVFD